MKLNELKSILYSNTGSIVWVIVYDTQTCSDLEQCSIEHAIKIYGEHDVKRIYPYENQLVIEL